MEIKTEVWKQTLQIKFDRAIASQDHPFRSFQAKHVRIFKVFNKKISALHVEHDEHVSYAMHVVAQLFWIWIFWNFQFFEKKILPCFIII